MNSYYLTTCPQCVQAIFSDEDWDVSDGKYYHAYCFVLKRRLEAVLDDVVVDKETDRFVALMENVDVDDYKIFKEDFARAFDAWAEKHPTWSNDFA